MLTGPPGVSEQTETDELSLWSESRDRLLLCFLITHVHVGGFCISPVKRVDPGSGTNSRSQQNISDRLDPSQLLSDEMKTPLCTAAVFLSVPGM